jgi:hypothetical protein
MTSHFRKTDVVRIFGYIEELIFGKFKQKLQRRQQQQQQQQQQQSSEKAITTYKNTSINRHPKGFEYVIARFKIEKTIEEVGTRTTPRFNIRMTPPVAKKSETVLIKGNLPYHSRYFDYALSCVKKWDPRYNQEYYQILSVVEVKLSSVKLSPWICQWIACTENEGTVQFFISTMGKYTGKPIFDVNKIPKPPKNSKQIGLDVSKFPDHVFSSTMYPKSEFYKWICGEPLLTLIPRDAHAVLSDLASTFYVEKILTIAANPNESWKLMTKKGRKSIYSKLKHKPSVRWHVVAPNAVLPLIEKEEEKEENLKSGFSAPLFLISEKHSDSLNFYRRAKNRYRTRLCSTSFMIDRFSIENKDESDSDSKSSISSVLCDEMQLLVREKAFGGQEMFTFKKDFDVQSKIVDFYKILWTRWNDFPVTNEFYQMDARLSEDQKRALNSVSTVPMINVIALPGRGKSFLIAEIGKKYKNVAVVTHIASLAAQLREKVPQVITICSSIAKNKYDERKRLMELSEIEDESDVFDEGEEEKEKNDKKKKVDSLFAHIEVLIVDEAEDVENVQMNKLYSVFKNVSRLVHVYDPEQILPIGPGNLALDLQNVMRGTVHNVILQQPFRFGHPGITSNVVRNDEMLLKKNVKEMIFHSFLLKSPPERTIVDPLDTMSANDRKDLVFLVPLSNEQIDGPVKLKDNLIALDRAIQGFFSADHSITCISLTNKFKDVINAYIEKKRNPKGNLFYAFQRITVIDNNFEKKRLDRVDPTTIAIRKKEEEKKKKKKKKEEKNVERDFFSNDARNEDPSDCWFSHGVKNGESYTISHIKDYSVVAKSWVENSVRTEASISDVENYDKANLRRCLITTNGRIICVHPDYVPHEKIKPGWAITVDKAKGLEYDNVLLTFDAQKDGVFPINHFHVALTRAKQVTYVMNTVEAFRKLVMSPNKQRFDLMEWRLSRWFDTVKHRSCVVPAVTNSSVVAESRRKEKSGFKRKRSFTEITVVAIDQNGRSQRERVKRQRKTSFKETKSNSTTNEDGEK